MLKDKKLKKKEIKSKKNVESDELPLHTFLKELPIGKRTEYLKSLVEITNEDNCSGGTLFRF
jgi:hypothetical protein